MQIPYESWDAITDTGLAAAVSTTNETRFFRSFEPEAIAHYEAFGAQFGIGIDRMVRVNQQHSGHVIVVSSQDGGNHITRRHREEAADGMVTNEPGLMLCTITADCVPVFLLDPVKKAIGLVHSGWRGTAKEIAGAAVSAMYANFGSNPADVIACLGPYICADCYEVSNDLVDSFSEKFTEKELTQIFNEKGHRALDMRHVPEKLQLNLGKAITFSLLRSGLKRENIHDVRRCSYHDEHFVSYRKTQDHAQHILSAIYLSR